MFRKQLFIAVLIVAASGITHATVTFQNTGNKEGWPNFPQTPQAMGTISDVTAPAFQGNTAIKFTQTWIPNYSGRYHSEVVFQNIEKTGDDRYYGLAVYLEPNWVFAGDNICIQQWAGDGPWMLMEIRGHNLIMLRHAHGVIKTLQTMPAGQWVRIVTHFRMSKNGIFEVWVNGVKKMSLADDFSVPATSGEARWSAGEYVTGWFGVHTKPSPSFRQLFQDHYRVATTQAEAEPANWNETTASLNRPHSDILNASVLNRSADSLWALKRASDGYPPA
jgi:hypothetical protein